MVIDSLALGQKAEAKRSFTRSDVEAYASVSDDTNPTRLDSTFGATISYGLPVVQEMLVVSLFTSILGNTLPGVGTVLVGYMLKFLKPVFVGDSVIATVEIVSIRRDVGLVRLATHAGTSRGLCVDGEALVRIPPFSAAHA